MPVPTRRPAPRSVRTPSAKAASVLSRQMGRGRSADHARAGRDRRDVARSLVTAGLGDGTEGVEEAGIEAGAVVDREVDRAVAEALQHLAEAADAVLALTPDLLK